MINPVIIGGRTLTEGEVMTLRVALANFIQDMAKPDALGGDEHGRDMAKAYLRISNNILQQIRS